MSMCAFDVNSLTKVPLLEKYFLFWLHNEITLTYLFRYCQKDIAMKRINSVMKQGFFNGV